MIRSIRIVTLTCACIFFLSACKSSQVATDGAMEEGPVAVEEGANEVVSVSKETSMAAELVQKSIEARGGMDKIKAIETMTWNAGMEMMGMDMPLTVQFKRPNKMRQVIEVSAMNATITTGFDGKTAWMKNPMQGQDAQKLPDEQAQEMRDRGAMDGAMVSYIEKGYEITYGGEEAVNDKPAHVLIVQLPEDKTARVFLDAESYLEVKSVQSSTNPMTGEKGELSTYSSDYREVGGILIPHKITAEFDGNPLQELLIESIEVNQPISDALFEMPGMVGSAN